MGAIKLRSITTEVISFGDLDPMGILWHGNYFRLLELGRQKFGKEHDLDALAIYDKGFFTPIVHSHIDHKAPLEYDDVAEIITELIPTPAAKIILRYTVLVKATQVLSATAETIQVFLDKERKLELNCPEFYDAWKASKGIVDR